MRRKEVHGVAVPAVDVSKFGVADADRLLQHGCKHRARILPGELLMTWSTSAVRTAAGTPRSARELAARRAVSHRQRVIGPTSPMRSAKANDRPRSVKCRLRSRSYNSPNGAMGQQETKLIAANCAYSITSSAAASRFGGTVKPSALAALRLITNSYLFGACTGRSPGFSPLRMRSTYLAAGRNWLTVSGP